jgi:hypothetical protein
MGNLHTLADMVQTGDATATAELRQELETQMVHIVRRAIRAGTGRTPLARQILAEADRVAPRGWDYPAQDRESLIGTVARRLCESVIGNLQGRAAGHRRALETVCN